jgi:hypothetical protein
MKLDIIGDIHGRFQTLERLFKKLGYAGDRGVWKHEERVALFLGDYIDRGSPPPVGMAGRSWNLPSLWQNWTATELSLACFRRRLSGEGLVAPERKTTRFSAECEVVGRQYSQQ